MLHAAQPLRPAAVLFDMDGTITRPLLDFDAIRRDLGIEGPILEGLRHLTGDRLQDAHQVLGRHERIAAERSELNDGCVQVLGWLNKKGCATALITRNSRSSTRIVLEKHALRFDLVLTRDDAPAKPDPRALQQAIEALVCQPADAWMVGDGRHDVEAAVAAGVHSIWISHGLERTFDTPPDLVIPSLSGLMPVLESTIPSPRAVRRV